MTRTESRKAEARRARATQVLQFLDDRVRADMQRSGAVASQQHLSNRPNSSDFKSNFAIPANVRSLPPHTVLQLPQIRFLIRRLNPRLLDLLQLVPLEHIPGLIGCLNELDVPRDIWVLMFSGLEDDPIDIWMKFMSRPQTSKLQIQLASEQPTSSESPNAPANEQPSHSDNAAHDFPQGAGGIELDRIAKNDAVEVGRQPEGISVANDDPPPYEYGIEASRSASEESPQGLGDIEQPSDSDNAAHNPPQEPGDIELQRVAKNDAAEVEHQPGGMVVANNDPPAYDDGNQAPRPVPLGLRACQQAFLHTVGYPFLACLFSIYLGWLLCNLQKERACKCG
jgi:hypothetical protein